MSSEPAAPFGMSSLQVPILFFMGLNLLSNFSGELLPCDIQTTFATNMYAKHLLGAMLMLFFNIMNDPVNAENIGRSVGEALLLYLWFVLLSRTHALVALAIAGVVFSVYVIDIRYQRHVRDGGKESAEAAGLKKASLVLKWVALGMTLAGVVHYMILKKKEYSDAFGVLRFFLGTPTCKRN